VPRSLHPHWWSAVDAFLPNSTGLRSSQYLQPSLVIGICAGSCGLKSDWISLQLRPGNRFEQYKNHVTRALHESDFHIATQPLIDDRSFSKRLEYLRYPFGPFYHHNRTMTRVLLTGADTLTGSHVLAQLLSQDAISVRAVVQSRDAAQAIHEQYRRCPPSSLDFVALPADEEIVYGTMENALCDLSRPFEAILHTLIPKHSDAADCLSAFVKLETEEVLRFLNSVQHTAHYVRRVVLVTSLVPFARWLVHPHAHGDPAQNIRQDSPTLAVDVEHILATSQASSSTMYDAILQWMKISGARFDIAYVSTPSVYGPSVHPLETSSDLSDTNRRIWNICSNEPPERTEIPPHGITHYADVRVSCRGRKNGS